MIGEIIANNRLFSVLSEEVLNYDSFDPMLYEKIQKYTEEYIESEQGDNGIADKAYMNFIRSYNKDMKAFVKTGKYPLELDLKRASLKRYDYNIVLLFSCLFTPHRFRIMQLIQQKSRLATNGLVIGCGPGLEIELIKSKIAYLYAYDLVMDSFLNKKHAGIQFKEEYFDGSDERVYDDIYLIELLEHLNSPYELLEICENKMTKAGRIYLTTATNIPQFDHLYNFESSHISFEKKIKQLNLEVEFMEEIPHRFITLDIKAKNRFYILKRIK